MNWTSATILTARINHYIKRGLYVHFMEYTAVARKWTDEQGSPNYAIVWLNKDKQPLDATPKQYATIEDLVSGMEKICSDLRQWKGVPKACWEKKRRGLLK